MNQNILVRTLVDIGEDNAGLEVVVLPDGKAFCTQSSYSRYANMSQQAISKRCQNLEVVDVESITNISPTTLVVGENEVIKTKLTFPNGTNRIVVLIPAEIFGMWVIKDIPKLGKEIIKAGATQFLYKIAGYKVGVIEEKPKSTAEIILMQAQMLVEHEAKILALEAADKENKMRLQAVEELADANSDELERFSNGHGFWYSVIGFCAKHNLTNYSTQEAAAFGRRASAICKKAGIKPQKLNDPRFGKVNSYPEHILLEVIPC